jgi:hypothetical protein
MFRQDGGGGDSRRIDQVDAAKALVCDVMVDDNVSLVVIENAP